MSPVGARDYSTYESKEFDAPFTADHLRHWSREAFRALNAPGRGKSAKAQAVLDLNAFNPEAIHWAQEHAAELVATDAATKARIRALILRSQRDGIDPDRLARLLRDVIGLSEPATEAVANYQSQLIVAGIEDAIIERRVARYAEAKLRERALLIARTESVSALNAGQQILWEKAVDSGVIHEEQFYKSWLLAGDEGSCLICIENEAATEVPIGGLFPSGHAAPSAHPNCFAPWTRIVGASRVVAGLEANYSGPIVTLETLRGYRLTVTPNHPVLTPSGWVAADCLREGDNVLSERVRFRGSLSRWEPQDQDGPTTVEQIIDTLRSEGLRSTEISSNDLHGDALWTDRQVDIVGGYGELRNSLQSESMKGDPQVVFVLPDMEQACGSRARTHLKRREAFDLTGGSLPRAATLAFNGGAVGLQERPLQEFGFTLSPNDNTSVNQASPNDAARYSVFVRESLLGSAGKILSGNCRDVDATLPITAVSGFDCADDVPSTEVSPDAMSFDAQLARDLLIGEAGRIEVDGLVSVDHDTWTGHVVDLQTKDGYILAEGIIVSNCRCSVGLINRPAKAFHEREKYSATQPRDEYGRWSDAWAAVEASGYDAATALAAIPALPLHTGYSSQRAEHYVDNPFHPTGPASVEADKASQWLNAHYGEPMHWDRRLVSVDDVASLQKYLDADLLKSYAPKMEDILKHEQTASYGFEHGGKIWLQDGNHRANLLKLGGATVVPMMIRVIDSAQKDIDASWQDVPPGFTPSPTLEEREQAKGGAGSGNFGHAGRPGLVGGSGGGGAVAGLHEKQVAFREAFEAAFADSPFTAMVSHYTPAEIADGHMVPLTANDGKTGVLIHDHGDGRIEATALYNTSSVKGAGLALLKDAVADHGVNYVECYGPKLPMLYASLGFKTTEQYPFDLSQAAATWNSARFDAPDYHIMRLAAKGKARKARGTMEDPEWEAQYGAASDIAARVCIGDITPQEGERLLAELDASPEEPTERS